jgi:hypothetical protein
MNPSDLTVVQAFTDALVDANARDHRTHSDLATNKPVVNLVRPPPPDARGSSSSLSARLATRLSR